MVRGVYVILLELGNRRNQLWMWLNYRKEFSSRNRLLSCFQFVLQAFCWRINRIYMTVVDKGIHVHERLVRLGLWLCFGFLGYMASLQLEEFTLLSLVVEAVEPLSNILIKGWNIWEEELCVNF